MVMACHGALSNSAIATWPHGEHVPGTEEESHKAAKIARAMLSGPQQITKDATVAELLHDGNITTLGEGTNEWTCFPGSENEIGNVPMCANPMGLEWAMCLFKRKPAPTNKAPGLIYMLCGATQHCNNDPFDNTGQAIPIGPHWMITWPYDSVRDGIPNNVRDAGAWVMFDGTPYAYLHVSCTPWDGNVYHPEKAPNLVWTMQYLP
ncbi:hypothetical protein MMC28_010993 [Mycoblastus sanguinarius]|nr:hypothetical protein [Mycoblastus sanguinarius]